MHCLDKICFQGFVLFCLKWNEACYHLSYLGFLLVNSNTMATSNHRRKGLLSSYNSQVTLCRKSGVIDSGLFLVAFSVCFLSEPRTIYPGWLCWQCVGSSHISHQSRRRPTDFTTSQFDGGIFSADSFQRTSTCAKLTSLKLLILGCYFLGEMVGKISLDWKKNLNGVGKTFTIPITDAECVWQVG